MDDTRLTTSHTSTAASTTTRGLFDLPTEVVWKIEIYLTKSDRTSCIRVCRAWYQAFIKDIWRTLGLRQNHPRIDFRANVRSPYDSTWLPVPEGTAFEILGRNMHWVKILSIDLTTLQALTEQRGTTVEAHSWSGKAEGGLYSQLQQPRQERTAVQELCRLEDLTVIIDHHHCTTSPITPLNLEPIIIILQASTQLRKFAIQLDYKHACCGHDKEMTSLFRALPKSLEQLTVGCLPDQGPKRFETANEKQDSGNMSFMDTKPVTLEKLKSLYLLNFRTKLNDTILKELLLPPGRCPALNELHVHISPDTKRYDSYDHEADLCESLVRIIYSGNRTSGETDKENGGYCTPCRWRTMGFKRLHRGLMDYGVVAAILDPRVCVNLENLLIDGCEAFGSAYIQALLCSAPRLKRFSSLPSAIETDQDDEALPIEAFMLKANDIVSSEWVCLELESFRCIIGGIPRPDVAERTNGWKLLFDLNNPNLYSMEDSRVVQRQVLTQLGRLTQLRELSLGKDHVEVEVYRCRDFGCYGDYYCRFEGMNHQLDDEDYCRRYMIDYDPAQQYQCLALTLEDGLDLLEELRAMKKLEAECMNIQKGNKEIRWIEDNWPEFDHDENWMELFWAERGYFDPLLRWIIGPEADMWYGGPYSDE